MLDKYRCFNEKLVGENFKSAYCPLVIPYFPTHLDSKLNNIKGEICLDANLATVKTSIKDELIIYLLSLQSPSSCSPEMYK